MLSKDISPWNRTDLDWTIVEELEDFEEDLQFIFYKLRMEIQSIYWEVREEVRRVDCTNGM